jgi:uncharacterized membrane protein YuzA (DUF378 family)
VLNVPELATSAAAVWNALRYVSARRLAMAALNTPSRTRSSLSPATWVAIALVVIGALNWGLIGLFGFNLVAAIFGAGTFSRIIYVIVALAGLYLLVDAFRMREERHLPAVSTAGGVRS